MITKWRIRIAFNEDEEPLYLYLHAKSYNDMLKLLHEIEFERIPINLQIVRMPYEGEKNANTRSNENVTRDGRPT